MEFAMPMVRVTTVVPRVSFMPNYVLEGNRVFSRGVHNTFVAQLHSRGKQSFHMYDYGDDIYIPTICDEEYKPKYKKGLFKSVKAFFLKHFSKQRNSVVPALLK